MEMDYAQLRLTSRGQLFGFITALLFLIASTVMVLYGHGLAGAVIGSIDLVSLVAVFVTGRYPPVSSSPKVPPSDPKELKSASEVRMPSADGLDRLSPGMDKKIRDIMYGDRS
jgi:hypothetical protein